MFSAGAENHEQIIAQSKELTSFANLWHRNCNGLTSYAPDILRMYLRSTFVVRTLFLPHGGVAVLLSTLPLQNKDVLVYCGCGYATPG